MPCNPKGTFIKSNEGNLVKSILHLTNASYNIQQRFIFSIFRYDVRTNRPILTEYMERIRNQLQPHYDDIHHIVNNISDTFKGEIPKMDELAGKMEVWFSQEKR